MISPVYVFYSEVDELVHFLSVDTDRVYLKNKSCVVQWYLLVASLSLELYLTTLLFVLFHYLSLVMINRFKYNEMLSTIV